MVIAEMNSLGNLGVKFQYENFGALGHDTVSNVNDENGQPGCNVLGTTYRAQEDFRENAPGYHTDKRRFQIK